MTSLTENHTENYHTSDEANTNRKKAKYINKTVLIFVLFSFSELNTILQDQYFL